MTWAGVLLVSYFRVFLNGKKVIARESLSWELLGVVFSVINILTVLTAVTAHRLAWTLYAVITLWCTHQMDRKIWAASEMYTLGP